MSDLHDRFTASLNAEQRALWLEVEADMQGRRDDREDAIVAELARHLPGMAAAIRSLAEHVLDRVGRLDAAPCCTEDASA